MSWLWRWSGSQHNSYPKDIAINLIESVAGSKSRGFRGKPGKKSNQPSKMQQENDGIAATDQERISRAVDLVQTGCTREAEAICRKLIKENSQNALVYGLLASICAKTGREEEAISLLAKALFLKQDYPEALYLLGLILHGQRRLVAAVASFKKALFFRPNYPEALDRLGCSLYKQGNHIAAIASYKKALSFLPNFPEAFTHLGIALLKEGEIALAISYIDKALSLRPNDPEALTGLGMVLHAKGDLDSAISSWYKALSFQPSYPDAHFSLSLCLLQTGNYEEGWEHYEWRLKRDNYRNTLSLIRHPAWQPALKVKRLLVCLEQGIGDQVMFYSMLLEANKLAPHILVQADGRLVPLLRRSMPEIDFHSSQLDIDDRLYDAYLPMGSLGKYLRRSVQDFHSARPKYLVADKERSAHLRKQLARDGGLLCGISWKSLNDELGPSKSLSLEMLGTTLGLKRIRLVSLQYGEVQEEIEDLKAKNGIEIHQEPSVDNFHDLDGLAALIEACDLVITISNTTAHLAGSLGKHTYLLLPMATSLSMAFDWRWGLAREGTLWYPSMRIFRQRERGDWAEVMGRVREELEIFMTNFDAGAPSSRRSAES